MLSLFLEHEESILKRLKKNKWVLVIAAIPFLLNALGLIYTDEFEKGLDFTIRAIPFLFLPLIAILSPNIFNKNYKKFGYALTLGCLFVMLYSWSFSILDIQSQNKPLKELFGPLYSHHNLIKALDLHAAYLSICIYTAIGFIILVYKNLKRTQQIIAIITITILSLFMFHLLSRNAIIYYLLASTVFLAYYRKWKILTLAFITVIILGTLAYNVKHNYLRDRIFNNLNFFEKETQFSKKDDRFDRLAASYEVFMQKPIIGYGTAAESKHRREVFKKNKDTIGYERNFNAHNQFFEYLSTFGIIGGVAYVLFFTYLFYVCVKTRNGFYIFVTIGLFFACLTESIFERSQGVVYSALIIALILSFHIMQSETKP
ncbi:O-antigen ligase family protein [Flavobacteriaceae bacterium S0862]|nr:O-antigen ligase family protein [Flavobacteriaceae bacterium S0862]